MAPTFIAAVAPEEFISKDDEEKKTAGESFSKGAVASTKGEGTAVKGAVTKERETIIIKNVAMGEEDEPPPKSTVPSSESPNDRGGKVTDNSRLDDDEPTMLDVWVMFGEALFGNASISNESAETTGTTQPRRIFVQPLPNTGPNGVEIEVEMEISGVRWEEGDDPALIWTSNLLTAGLSSNFTAVLPSFTNILRHRGISKGNKDTPPSEASIMVMQSAVNGAAIGTRTK